MSSCHLSLVVNHVSFLIVHSSLFVLHYIYIYVYRSFFMSFFISACLLSFLIFFFIALLRPCFMYVLSFPFIAFPFPLLFLSFYSPVSSCEFLLCPFFTVISLHVLLCSVMFDMCVCSCLFLVCSPPLSSAFLVCYVIGFCGRFCSCLFIVRCFCVVVVVVLVV